jgi:hypothetical protein
MEIGAYLIQVLFSPTLKTLKCNIFLLEIIVSLEAVGGHVSEPTISFII